MQKREKILLDLFTEVAVLEHLVRNHVGTIDNEHSAGEFGALNYFMRNMKTTERLSILAWCFQVTEDAMDVHLNVLESKGLIARTIANDDHVIALTDAGRQAHADAMIAMAPEIEPLMEEFPDADLEMALGVLKEIRRVFDNLPER